jgi:hypothetical protein
LLFPFFELSTSFPYLPACKSAFLLTKFIAKYKIAATRSTGTNNNGLSLRIDISFVTNYLQVNKL